MVSKIKKLRKKGKSSSSAKMGKVGKQSNSSAAKKRIARTKGGKGEWNVQKSCRNHLLMQKTTERKKEANKHKALSSGNIKKVAKLLPSF